MAVEVSEAASRAQGFGCELLAIFRRLTVLHLHHLPSPTMAAYCSLLLALLLLALSSSSPASAATPYGIEFPQFNAAVADAGCDGKLVAEEEALARRVPPLKLHMTHRSAAAGATGTGSFFLDSAEKDAVRIDTMHRRVALSGSGAGQRGSAPRRALSERVLATVESGVAVGSGEYLVDVYVGTPPRRFRMIMDTGSDLNWLQCAPCLDCFEQSGPIFDPAASTSYRNVTCGDERCGLVSPPAPRECRRPRSDPCPYYYWYGDQSNTTGDLALEAFTVNLTATGTRRVDGVAFGCGHQNRGLFHGAGGLLGLGRGPLSFASQLRGVYGGHAFSYCLVEHGSAAGSKVIFGHDDALLAHPQLNYTAFAPATDTDTFYYLQLKSVLVGGEAVNISSDTLAAGGTIIDSGTTLSYFPEPAYRAIRQAFIDRMSPSYPLIAGFPVLSPCYNVSGAGKIEVPELALVFADGAAWEFPAENYFIRLEPEGVMCLAVLGTLRSGMSIIGNYQQQNFHVLYDLERNRLGFAPRRCAEV
ncbi:aspartic proteinase nepenthesin-2-like [Triticum dicoccoides]|uniref:aspartic proteinase nepenthesin-2-like n=1 Tax=Triticum dicoccoides TaxID=85692 RepID=UPI0018916A40|nr:aspartic proteinase nepenthesin-2-like [Triticum dicoccoides]